MYTLELGIWERLQLNICLPRDAPWSEMEQLVRISKVIGLTDKEKDAIGLVDIKINTLQGTFGTKTWDVDKLAKAETSQTIKLKAVDFMRLKKDADARTNWPREEQSLTLKAKMESAVED